MLTERNKNKFGESPYEILNRCLGKDDFTDWDEWRDNNKMGYISLKGARLGNVKLKGADLSQVDLKGADLKNSNLSGADLSKANLVGADLSHANLIGADLWKADLKFANLWEANLKSAHLEDVRGHGGSDLPDIQRVHHWNIFADDLKTLIDQAMSPPIIGLGHSLGAVTTYIAAATYPRLFSAIILIDPPIFPPRMLWLIAVMKWLGLAGKIPLARGARRRKKTFQGKKEALKRFASGRGIFKTWSLDFVEAYLECGLLEKDSETAILKCDPELEAQIFESVPLDVWKYADKVSCPVLAIRGELSDTFRVDAAERLKRKIANCQLETIANAGHFVPMGKPKECARAITDFIKRN